MELDPLVTSDVVSALSSTKPSTKRNTTYLKWQQDFESA